MRNCIFCKIISGEIPSLKIYEDELVLAFMDIAPINFGHVLVIPKAHHTSVASIPEDIGGRMFRVGSRIGVAMRRGIDADGFNLHLSDGTTAGQVVMHAHLHIVPRFVDDGFHWNWRQLKYESDAQKNEILERISTNLILETAASEIEVDASDDNESSCGSCCCGNHGS